MEPTIVFAGAGDSSIPLLRECGVDAMMASYMNVGKSKKYQQTMRDISTSATWKPVTYLDSGIFTFMRRAQVVHQPVVGKIKDKGPATWEEFRAFAQGFVNYVKAEKGTWDHIIELDTAELFGVESEDALRRQLRGIVGDRLLPVWHHQRGYDGWIEMAKQFPYIALAPTTKFGNRSDGRFRQDMVRMLAAAHEHGANVHILGVETLEWFDYGADSIDASSWTAGARFGQFKLGGNGNGPAAVSVPQKEQSTPGGGRYRGRRWHHTRIMQFEDMIRALGFAVTENEIGEFLAVPRNATMVGIKMVQARQEEARNVRLRSQTTG